MLPCACLGFKDFPCCSKRRCDAEHQEAAVQFDHQQLVPIGETNANVAVWLIINIFSYVYIWLLSMWYQTLINHLGQISFGFCFNSLWLEQESWWFGIMWNTFSKPMSSLLGNRTIPGISGMSWVPIFFPSSSSSSSPLLPDPEQDVRPKKPSEQFQNPQYGTCTASGPTCTEVLKEHIIKSDLGIKTPALVTNHMLFERFFKCQCRIGLWKGWLWPIKLRFTLDPKENMSHLRFQRPNPHHFAWRVFHSIDMTCFIPLFHGAVAIGRSVSIVDAQWVFSTQSEQPSPTVRAMVAKAGSVQKKPAIMQKATKKPVRKEGKTSKVQRGRLHACVAYSTEVLQTPLQVMGLHKEDHVVELTKVIQLQKSREGSDATPAPCPMRPLNRWSWATLPDVFSTEQSSC